MRLPFAWAFAAALLLLLSTAEAAPLRCEPAPAGTGTYSETRDTPDGTWSVHFCKTQCAWEPQIVVKRRDYVMQWPSAASAAGMSARELYREVYRLNANTPLNDPSLASLAGPALRWAIDNEPDRPPCSVAPTTNGAATRPVYYLDPKGNVGHLSATRVTPGTLCNCSYGQRVIGTVTYCAFKGAAIEPLTEVAVCRAAP